ncbi:MAG: glycosyltransferase family 2 protein [Opitutales bacterium]|nr:glycosyltransferase family 2 protein [Opitutales bacterium]
MSAVPKNVHLSFVIPVCNEEGTVGELFAQIKKAVEEAGEGPMEVIFVDDGSTDGSWKEITKLHEKYPEEVKALAFRRNFGKAAALAEGFEEACGEIVFTLDADLQDDPLEISRFLEKIREGYDLVSGWKKDRKDPLGKTVPSRFFNFMTRMVSGVRLHDFNCGFKAYRQEVVKNITLYGELHRYIPVLANGEGFRITEIPVRHRPREQGVSKYGWKRFLRGFLDLMTVVTTTRYLMRPAHLFGGLGILLGALGAGILIYLSAGWFMGFRGIGSRPLFFFGILFTLLSAQFLSLGLVSELILKTSNERNKRHLLRERKG